MFINTFCYENEHIVPCIDDYGYLYLNGLGLFLIPLFGCLAFMWIYQKCAKPIDKVLFHKMSDLATIPTRGSPFSAGFDISSAYNYIVPAHGKELIKTQLKVTVPSNTYGRLAPRSGLAWKNFIDVGAGVIDKDYKGEVGVVLYNHSDIAFKVLKGDRIAQLIPELVSYCEAQEVGQEYFPELTVTRSLATDEEKKTVTCSLKERGSGGFGSTGVSEHYK